MVLTMAPKDRIQGEQGLEKLFICLGVFGVPPRGRPAVLAGCGTRLREKGTRVSKKGSGGWAREGAGTGVGTEIENNNDHTGKRVFIWNR
jgi:hypothetical protein